MSANRFAKRKLDFSGIKDLILPVLFFVCFAVLFWQGLGNLRATSEKERLKSTREAVTRAVVQCYAVEGQYPPDIDYLREHYGLSVDEELYIVDYQIFASNIMPTILILPKNLEMDDGSDALPPDVNL